MPWFSRLLPFHRCVIGMTGLISFHEWMRSAMRSRLAPFKRFARMLRPHLEGILPWTRLRLSRGAVEGMNNKIKSSSHRSFGFRSGQHFIAAVYHCCAKLRHLLKPNYTLWRGAGLRFGVDFYSERWDRVLLRRDEEACAYLTHFRLASGQSSRREDFIWSIAFPSWNRAQDGKTLPLEYRLILTLNFLS